MEVNDGGIPFRPEGAPAIDENKSIDSLLDNVQRVREYTPFEFSIIQGI